MKELKRKIFIAITVYLSMQVFIAPMFLVYARTTEVLDEHDQAAIPLMKNYLEINDEVPVQETESPDEDIDVPDNLKVEKNRRVENQENEQTSEEVSGPVAEVLEENQTDETDNFEDSGSTESRVFDRETAEVITMAQFREAVANPEIGIISVRANLIEDTTNILTVDRPVLIQGNGHTLTFGINELYFQLEEVKEASTIRIENAKLTKVGVTPLINSTVESSKNWTVELESITEDNENTMQLASLPEGRIVFTGGISNFTREVSTQTFIEAKEVVVTNQAEVTISRGNATIFFSSATVANPKLVVEHGSSLIISTTVGTSVVLDFRGYSPSIDVNNRSSIFIGAVGFGGQVTNTSNLVMSLSGENSSININGKSKLDISVTGLKRGINMNGSNSKLKIDNSELVVKTDSATGINMIGDNLRFETNNKSSVLVKANSGTAMNLSGKGPIVYFSNSEIEIDTTTGSRINMVGDDSFFNLNDSTLEMRSITGRGIYLQGVTPQVFLEYSQLNINDADCAQGLILQGEDALLSLSNQSEFTANSLGSGIRENVLIGGGNDRPKISVTDESSLSITTTGSSQSVTDRSNNALRIEGFESQIEVKDSSKVSILIKNGSKRGMLIRGDENKVIVNGNSEIDVSTQNGNGIEQVGSRTLFEMKSNAKMFVNTNVPAGIDAAGFFLGDRNETSSNGNIKLSDNSLIDIHAKRASAITLLNQGSKFSIESGSKINLKTDSSNGQFATLRFRTFGDYVFQLDNAEMNIVKNGGDAPAIRMFGGNNVVNLKRGAKFDIYNKGNGVPHDGDVISGGNIGIHYTVGGGSFNISGEGTIARIRADNGPALDMGGNSGAITTKNGGSFEAQGKTATSEGSIFRANILHVDFDNPFFMDFRNTRPGGGTIFNVENGSSLRAINSDLAVWLRGADLDSDPDRNFPGLDFSFEGRNFNTLVTTSNLDVLNPEIFGNGGLAEYSRLSSNNTRWTIADELRIPTNADKKIHGHISIPVGLEDSRSAWDGEVTVIVEVERKDGSKTEYKTTTVGHSIDNPGISIYGEKPRGGLFEIELKDYLRKGEKIRIKETYLTSCQLTEGYENIILTETVDVFPIIPPAPAQFSSSLISNNSISIHGYSEKQDVEVTATLNGQPLNTETVTMDLNGHFTIDLSEVSLEINDKIQVFLRDDEGSAKEAGVINPPETNNTRGNINPATELEFHDVIFEPAVTLIVSDMSPVSPVDPLNPESEMNPENKPDLPEEQGLLSIDFVSAFNFDSQGISVHNQTYYAQPQRLLNEDGTVNETQERPNYIQISDRRPESERNSWELAVTQKEQFKNEENQVLKGASLSLSNQQIITAQGGTSPVLQSFSSQLVPRNRRTLLKAQGSEGTGTWVYRFGDGETAGKSVALDVPKGANPEATIYSTTLIWELSSVPNNIH